MLLSRSVLARRTNLSTPALSAILGYVVSGSGIAEPAAAKHWLFDPVPKAALREMSTDRPDKTESAYTVDAGHFQIESDLLAYSRDHDRSAGADSVAEGWVAGGFNLKAGVTDWMDIQFLLNPYNRLTLDDRLARRKTTQSGVGDLTTRFKMNLWGNDGGTTALALMPFLTFPTSEAGLGTEEVEGGLVVPMAIELPWGWGLGMMTEVDFVADDSGADHTLDFINTITLGHDIVGPLAGYMEFFSQVSAEGRYEWIGTFDVGLTYGISANIQLDAGVNIGLTDSAEDINPFLGLSWRY